MAMGPHPWVGSGRRRPSPAYVAEGHRGTGGTEIAEVHGGTGGTKVSEIPEVTVVSEVRRYRRYAVIPKDIPALSPRVRRKASRKLVRRCLHVGSPSSRTSRKRHDLYEIKFKHLFTAKH